MYVHTHTHPGILVIKKNETLLFAATWNLEIVILSEINQTNTMSLVCGI